MRIISGDYGGRVLKNPPDGKTRPTSERLRETLFNILAPHIGGDTRFLDLCAGTGAIGIEAISRGANFAGFVDISRRACALIEENLDLLKIPEKQTQVWCSPAENFVSRKQTELWDIIYFDPPYSSDYQPVFLRIYRGRTRAARNRRHSHRRTSRQNGDARFARRNSALAHRQTRRKLSQLLRKRIAEIDNCHLIIDN